MKEDIFYMKIAYEEAQKAYKKGEIPVGCVIVDEQDGKILAQAQNLRDNTNIAVNHAEIIAIIKANKIIKNWRLVNCIMYSTLKPCEMCMEVIKNSKIKKEAIVLFTNLIKERNVYRTLKLQGLDDNKLYRNNYNNMVLKGYLYKNIGINLTRWFDEFTSLLIYLVEVNE